MPLLSLFIRLIMIDINVALVNKLINSQFPEWQGLTVKPIKKSGHDNRTFHLGDKKLVRLPSAERYASQPDKEYEWMPKLSKYISLPIPSPIAKGKPSFGYPYSWTVTPLLQGEAVEHGRICDMRGFIVDLVNFLKELQSADTDNAPVAGRHNFYRGGNLSIYDVETRRAVDRLQNVLPADKLLDIWNAATSTQWKQKDVWVHGDMEIGNLLTHNGSLSAVIDFGCSAVGDPACDYVMAWTFFDADNRKLFFKLLNCDKDMICRARGWTLWKALINYGVDYGDAMPQRVIDAILNE